MKYLLAFFLLSNISHGQVAKVGEQEAASKTRAMIKELASLKAEDYIDKFQTYRTFLKQYLVHKQKNCQGEFSTFVFNEKGNTKNVNFKSQKRKLSQAEKDLCLQELKSIESSFIEGMYQARLKYLKFLHAKELKSLEETKQKSLEDLKA